MQNSVKKVAVIAVATVMSISLNVNAGESIVLDGSTTVAPVAKAFAGYFMKNNPEVEVTISASGSGNGAA